MTDPPIPLPTASLNTAVSRSFKAALALKYDPTNVFSLKSHTTRHSRQLPVTAADLNRSTQQPSIARIEYGHTSRQDTQALSRDNGCEQDTPRLHIPARDQKGRCRVPEIRDLRRGQEEIRIHSQHQRFPVIGPG
jgi:hypothetical protein